MLTQVSARDPSIALNISTGPGTVMVKAITFRLRTQVNFAEVTEIGSSLVTRGKLIVEHVASFLHQLTVVEAWVFARAASKDVFLALAQVDVRFQVVGVGV